MAVMGKQLTIAPAQVAKQPPSLIYMIHDFNIWTMPGATKQFVFQNGKH